ncbi:MAG: ABC transporter ATP-binding protein [Desulfuromonas sp.]|nr:ABC transporter ATP-binding protein [Desulfuromonas sp.]
MNLTLHQISFAYRGTAAILKSLNANIATGQLTALLGINGSGKSTLLKLMAGILTPNQGSIILGEPVQRPLAKLRPRKIARYCAYVAQNTTPPALTVFDYVLLGRLPHQHGWNTNPSAADLDQVEICLEQMELTALAATPMTNLSGGQVQMAVIARALAQQPSILLLDEPTNNLDPKHQVQLMDKLHAISQQQQTTVIFSMHDINLALQWADRLLLLNDGHLYKHIPTAQLTANDLTTMFGLNYKLYHPSEDQRWFWPQKLRV